MIKVKLLIILMLTGYMLTGQQITPEATPVEKDYLQKSINQMKASKILLITGGALIVTAIAIPRGKKVYDGICIDPYFCDDRYKNDNLKSAFLLSGSCVLLASLPFYILSVKNKRKAASNSGTSRVEISPVWEPVVINKKINTGVALKIHL